MFLSSQSMAMAQQRTPRQGVILLVVLALITLFASIGVAFVYFAEQEATKAQDQKAGETVKLPDADLMFDYVMRQIVYPTNNNASALYTQSLLENAYGNVGVVPFSGSGARPRLYRDNRAGIVDGQLAAGYTTDPNRIGQDEMFRINRQYQTYNENVMGSLNPTYTYPDHKNAYLGAVSANYTDLTGTQHGPVAIARSFAREMKFRVAIINPAATAGNPNVVGYQDIIINPFSTADVNFWNSGSVAVNAASQRFYVKKLPNAGQPGGLPNPAPMQYANTPGTKPVLQAGLPAIQCDVDGNNAWIVLTADSVRAHTLRPEPRNNPNFPPPGDLGGDVKNLPPEVKTLVGFNGTTPIFANNDSHWMDVGFPAMQWSNNRKIKPLAAVFIMDNDGKVNMVAAGNVRGFDPTNGSFSSSGHGLGPWEINPRKLYPTTANPVLAAQFDQEYRQLFGGGQLNAIQYVRGKYGIDPNYGATSMDPSTINSNYWPLLRQAPYYSNYNADGTNDNAMPSNPNYLNSVAPQLPGQASIYSRFPSNTNTYQQGYSNGSLSEWTRGGALRSPLFFSPFAANQVSGSAFSNNSGSTQRSFPFTSMEAMYRTKDTGADKINSDLRTLMPNAFSFSLSRWQMTGISMDYNLAVVAPWFSNNNGDATMPRAAGGPTLLDSNTARPAAASVQLPWSAPSAPQGEFVGGGGQPLWRSIFGNTDRIDLAKQLPDYPLPDTNDTQLVMTDPVVKARYLIALHARQKLADQIFWRLVTLTHPDTTAGATGPNSPRWLAQLAVNIVDYIDNDDYPTWYQIPTITPGAPPSPATATASTANANNIVWGTELPRLVLNEVYCEAVNSSTGPDPVTGMTKATGDYHVRHWVELYNPLNDPPASDPAYPAWRDGSNARLKVGTTSVYRLVITPQDNVATIRTNFANTMGYPVDTNNAKTNVVTFDGTTAANVNIPPSNLNYGPLAAMPPQPANGFYLVAPPQQPYQTDPMSTFPTMATNPNNMYESPQMQVDNRITLPTPPGSFQDSSANRQAILLQRLANPYLPHNPVPEATPGTNLFTTNPGITVPEVSIPTSPYNPYITIDYIENISPNHSVEHNNTSSGNPDDANGNPLATGVENRNSVGKLQPYASLNARPTPGNPELLWVTQTPDNDLNTAGIQKLPNQVQHTFLRHNSIEPNTPQYGQKAGLPNGATPSANVNTLQLPFDWLVHLDRAPVSPAELLHVSGYRPHELTQMFHRVVNVSATLPNSPTTSLTSGNTVRFTSSPAGSFKFIGTNLGIPYSLKLNDLVRVTYTPNPAAAQIDEWVRVKNIDPNYAWFDGEVSNTTVVDQAVNVQIVVPYAHTAPWYRANENVTVQSSNRLYRLLETVAVRNPGVDVGQIRFTGTAVGPVQADGSRWVQLDNLAGIAGVPVITTNDALLAVESGVPAPLQLPAATYPVNQPTYAPFTPLGNPIYPNRVGDNVVFFAGTANEYRSMVLEIDWQNNRIRTVMPDPLVPAGNFFIDYTYHSGRQPGRINLNTCWDLESFLALADTKLMNAFFHDPKAIAPNTPPASPDREALVKLAFQRLLQQRQPGYFYEGRLVGKTGINNIGEDRPLQGMGTGDIAQDIEIPRQGIGNTLLSDRFQEDLNGYSTNLLVPRNDQTRPVPYEANGPLAGLTPLYSTPERNLSTLFEMYLPPPVVPAGAVAPVVLPDPAMNHPYRRFELLSKIWNNSTVRSNTFSVWVTIGFFEFDESTGIGAELGQIQGKNTRYRFFSVVDRSSIDSWLKTWQLHDNTASVNLFANSSIFPTIDPRDLTYPTQSVVSTNFAPVAGYGNVWQVNVAPGYPNPYQGQFKRLVEVESIDNAGVVRTERAMLLNPTLAPNLYSSEYVYPNPAVPYPYTPLYPNVAAIPSQQLFMRLTQAHSGLMTIRPLPVPPTVLHWTQMK